MAPHRPHCVLRESRDVRLREPQLLRDLGLRPVAEVEEEHDLPFALVEPPRGRREGGAVEQRVRELRAVIGHVGPDRDDGRSR